MRTVERSPAGGRLRLPALCAAFYLAGVAAIFMLVRSGLGGHFLYALDDPYIHLALAENLAHGHYGINPGEFASPSSSILWPFLLIPFAGTALHPYLPLLWNILFGSLAAWLIGSFVSRWVAIGEAFATPKQIITAILVMLCANLFGLTFLGMEHLLQVLLAICCAFGLIAALASRTLPAWSIAAAILAPLVRYEDLTLTLAICCALAGLRRWKAAAAVLAASLIPLIAFSLFLHHAGLPLLPLSVLVKGHAYEHGGLWNALRDPLHQFADPERLPLAILTLMFAALALKPNPLGRRWVFAGAALAGALQLLLGRFGWFYRYEVYAVILLVLLALRVLAESPRLPFAWFALGLTFCAAPYLRATLQIRTSTGDVYWQQYQMHRFVTSYYPGDYAVNDLGLVSYQRRPGAHILDLGGLGSLEASRQSDKTPAWLDAIAARHHIPLAMIYSEEFRIPPAWTRVARMCSTYQPLVVAFRCVMFYSTTGAGEPAIRTALQAFAPTLPSEVTLQFDPPQPEPAANLRR